MSSGPDARAASVSLRSATWVIALALAGVVAVVLFALVGPLSGQRPIGDGRNPATYGFDLSNLRVPAAALVASGNPRDFLASLDAPRTVPGNEIAERNQRERNKYAVPEDRVIGITIGPETRAYPLQLLNVHEIVNDELGGVPIAVTYSPLCDSAVVFDRRVGDRTLQFGVSGLLLDNNLVMYDKSPDSPSPSLWSQLAFGPIAGPACSRNERLTPLPGVQVSTWASWFLIHPETTIAMPNDSDWRRMKEFDYKRYWRDGTPTFPVASLGAFAEADPSVPFESINPTAAGLVQTVLSDMTMVIGVRAEDGWRVVPLRFMESLRTTAEGYVDTSAFGVRRMWSLVPVYGAVLVDSEPPPLMVPCRWFAWNAFHPMAR